MFTRTHQQQGSTRCLIRRATLGSLCPRQRRTKNILFSLFSSHYTTNNTSHLPPSSSSSLSHQSFRTLSLSPPSPLRLPPSSSFFLPHPPTPITVMFAQPYRRSAHYSLAPTPPPGLRRTPPLVGLQLHSSLVVPPSPPAPSSSSSSSCSSSSAVSSAAASPPSRYDASIMHRVVPSTLLHMTVKPDATALDIACHLQVPSHHVASHWITSRTPLSLPSTSTSTSSSIPIPIPGCSVERRRLTILSPAEANSYRQLASALRKALRAVQIEQTVSTTQQHIQQHQQPQIQTYIPPDAAAVASCGFATTGTHPDIDLDLASRRVARKKRQGLYRVARASACFAPTDPAAHYAEVLVRDAIDAGGLCIGLSARDTPLNRAVGAAPAPQVGYHALGKLVAANTWTDTPIGFDYGSGDVISVLARPVAPPLASSPGSLASDDLDDAVAVWFFKNGTLVSNTPYTLRTAGCTLYTACSLYKTNSKVELRCCQAQWQFVNQCSTAINLKQLPSPHCRDAQVTNKHINDKDLHPALHAIGSALTPLHCAH